MHAVFLFVPPANFAHIVYPPVLMPVHTVFMPVSMPAGAAGVGGHQAEKDVMAEPGTVPAWTV